MSDTTDLTLTQSALEFIQSKLSKDPKAIGLRLGIEKGGCSGSTYHIDFAKDLKEEDTVKEYGGVKIVVASQHWPYFKKTVIDCIKDDFGEYLKLNNPNVKGECGCGESVNFE
jgi:iron-sulfur cluster assembly protein